MTPPGEMLVCAGDAFRSQARRRREAFGQRRRAAAAASRAAATRARRAGGRYRHRARPAENAGPALAPADRQNQSDAKGKRAPLESVVGDKLRLIEPNAESDLERLTDSFHLNLTAFGLLSFFVGLFIVNSAIGLAFEQRLPMLRTLRACGVSARMLNAVLVIELVSLALVAGLIGLVCGYFIAAALLPDVAASLRGLYGAQIPGQLTLKGEWWLAGIAISILGALAAAAASLTKALRLPLLAAAQPYAWQQAQRRWLMFQSALALAVFATAGGLLWFGNSLIAGFAVLAALMLGAALILPMVLEIALSIGQRHASKPLSIWFWADSRQQLSGLSLALMALLLALAVNVGVGTMVESFSRTFLVWLDGRLAADVYVSAASDAQAAEIKAWLRERPEVEAILPGGRADTQMAGVPIEVLGLPDHATYRDNWPLLQSTPNAWTRLLPGDACFVSEQLARRLNLSVGDRIDSSRARRQLDARNRRHLRRLRQSQRPDRRQLRRPDAALPGHSADAARPAGRTARDSGAGRGAAGKIRARRSQRRRSGDDEGGIEANLQPHVLGDRGAQRLHARRRRHCALDQPADAEQFPPAATGAAMGDRHHDGDGSPMIELLKTMSVALITALFALPLGLLVAWCLLAVVNVKAFGWRLPFHVFPSQLLWLLGVAMAAALCAAALPVVRLARMQPASLIRIFANER